MNQDIAYYSSPLGLIKITCYEDKISGLSFIDHAEESLHSPSFIHKICMFQLDEYFSGHRKEFNLPLHLEGTEFQKMVWRALAKIPYGTTQSYAAIARQINCPLAVRALGMANHKNKIALILPCHRVIGSDGSMTGYASGVWRKEWLLQHEKRLAVAA